ncbi:uncharacterized protein LOC126552972 [Aphis gossypii]|uniref:uncharacterized protein LOC126552972 n=1 Tax=Aphis gossypii TaxID=80765 RepID=UPI00215903F6|nr:uncharacterized protein LOC126552972 [Aphis gossypii]
MYSLVKLSYYACSDDEKFIYDELETLKIDIQPCCEDIIRYQKKKAKLNIMDNDIDVKLIDDEDYTMSEKAAASGHIMCLEFAEGCGFPFYSQGNSENLARNTNKRMQVLPRTIVVAKDAKSGLIAKDYGLNGEIGNYLSYIFGLSFLSPEETRTVRARAAKNAINCRKNTRFRSFDNVICKEAACNGQLECQVYLYNNGCLWDEDTCRAAAFNGHMDVLWYAYEWGCPWDKFTC